MIIYKKIIVYKLKIFAKNKKPHSSVWIERGYDKPEVVGSSPTVAKYFFYY